MPQYQVFDAEDRIVETTKVTTGYFSDGGGVLDGSAMITSSITGSQKKYYHNIRENGSTNDEFSITFGSKTGAGSGDVTSHTKAIYQYFADLLLFPDEVETLGFQFLSGSTENTIFVIAAERARMKDRWNRKNWTLNLGATLGAPFDALTGYASSSNLYLTDDSDTVAPSPTPVGPRYNVVSGALGVKVGSTGFYADNHPYGYFYPNMGVIVLNGTALSASLPGAHPTSGSVEEDRPQGIGFAVDTNTTAKNHLKLYNALVSGSLQARSEEDQITTSYFVRARAAHFNFSNNPTFYSGSDATFSITEFTGNPQTFITTVGLHDAQGTMVAVGRLSTPVLKNFSTEFTAKVNLVH
tara:strand:- start:982 stop:2043 length:1062 start_codon:yes stop_codon:yes gene_type:complete